MKFYHKAIFLFVLLMFSMPLMAVEWIGSFGPCYINSFKDLNGGGISFKATAFTENTFTGIYGKGGLSLLLGSDDELGYDVSLVRSEWSVGVCNFILSPENIVYGVVGFGAGFHYGTSRFEDDFVLIDEDFLGFGLEGFAGIYVNTGFFHIGLLYEGVKLHTEYFSQDLNKLEHRFYLSFSFVF